MLFIRYISKFFSGGMNKSFISDADILFQKFDEENLKRSASQKKEVEKHRNIFNRKKDNRIQW